MWTNIFRATFYCDTNTLQLNQLLIKIVVKGSYSNDLSPIFLNLIMDGPLQKYLIWFKCLEQTSWFDSDRKKPRLLQGCRNSGARNKNLSQTDKKIKTVHILYFINIAN